MKKEIVKVGFVMPEYLTIPTIPYYTQPFMTSRNASRLFDCRLQIDGDDVFQLPVLVAYFVIKAVHVEGARE